MQMNTIPRLRTLGSVEVARVPGNPRVLIKGGLLLVLVNIVKGVVTPIRAILTDATGVTVWSRGHRRLLGAVTGSPKDFWCGHRVMFSTVAWGHGAVLCRAKSKNFAHVHPMVPQVPTSSAAHALSVSIPY